jgi:hypothetical protein
LGLRVPLSLSLPFNHLLILYHLFILLFDNRVSLVS